MPQYPMLPGLLAAVSSSSPAIGFRQHVVPYLVDVWLADYCRMHPSDEIVEVTPDDFSYLFDIRAGRLIAAWGISQGKRTGPRPAGRMRGHPKGGGALYHRGHAIPHTLGGGTDINLAPQLGAVNIGPFRQLEIQAVATPGALYFTYWIYYGQQGQRASQVEQGLLVPRLAPDIRLHVN